MRPTSHVATAQPAPVKNPTQNQTIISSRLTFVGILFSPLRPGAVTGPSIRCDAIVYPTLCRAACRMNAAAQDFSDFQSIKA